MDILISGRVQGVGFRYSCKKTADILEIKGTVTNCVNGDVFIEAEGMSAQMEKFLQWCHEGPSMALVVKVTCKQSDIKGFYDFKIIH